MTITKRRAKEVAVGDTLAFWDDEQEVYDLWTVTSVTQIVDDFSEWAKYGIVVSPEYTPNASIRFTMHDADGRTSGLSFNADAQVEVQEGN